MIPYYAHDTRRAMECHLLVLAILMAVGWCAHEIEQPVTRGEAAQGSERR